MGHLVLPADGTIWNGFSLLGESNLAITFGPKPQTANFNTLPFLILSGTTSVSIASIGKKTIISLSLTADDVERPARGSANLVWLLCKSVIEEAPEHPYRLGA